MLADSLAIHLLWLDSCNLHEDSYGRSTIVRQFLEGQLVVDIVCKSGLPYRHSVGCKTTPPSSETIQLLNEVIADPVLYSD